ncbi:MAG: DUF1919 domain-containing protein [Oscillospiraceae bacterium]|jgi:uncharacterized protein (DUF1919 family)|nr:DUF1919 domain-containing protein [Oscillospiraceae bacterium]
MPAQTRITAKLVLLAPYYILRKWWRLRRAASLPKRRERHCRHMRRRLRNNAPSIICNNCIGGYLLHDLGLEFRSPTINLWLEANDFCRFAQNLKLFLSAEWSELPPYTDGEGNQYPKALLRCPAGEITLYLQHYKTIAEAKSAWERRAARVDFDNLFLLHERRDTSPEQLQALEALPFERKLLLAKAASPAAPHSYALAAYDDPCGISAMERLGERVFRGFEEVDMLHFLNTGKIRRNLHYRNQ